MSSHQKRGDLNNNDSISENEEEEEEESDDEIQEIKNLFLSLPDLNNFSTQDLIDIRDKYRECKNEIFSISSFKEIKNLMIFEQNITKEIKLRQEKKEKEQIQKLFNDPKLKEFDKATAKALNSMNKRHSSIKKRLQEVWEAKMSKVYINNQSRDLKELKAQLKQYPNDDEIKAAIKELEKEEKAYAKLNYETELNKALQNLQYKHEVERRIYLEKRSKQRRLIEASLFNAYNNRNFNKIYLQAQKMKQNNPNARTRLSYYQIQHPPFHSKPQSVLKKANNAPIQKPLTLYSYTKMAHRRSNEMAMIQPKISQSNPVSRPLIQNVNNNNQYSSATHDESLPDFIKNELENPSSSFIQFDNTFTSLLNDPDFKFSSGINDSSSKSIITSNMETPKKNLRPTSAG